MKKALLVGINAYKSSPLRGCVNDTVNMKKFLIKNGFPEANITVLNDNNATTVNIKAELEKLVNTNPGDLVVFHYSGHGSQIPDAQGDEVDRLDEILCPVDIETNWYTNNITDDYLNVTFSKINSGALLEVFLDCCHSGTGTRNILMSNKEQESDSRFMMPPQEIFKKDINPEDFDIKTISIEQKNRVVWSGCRDDQTSADAFIAGSFCGAFTYGLLNNYTGSRNTIISNLRNFMKKNKYTQVPQLSCAVEQNNASLLSIGKYIPIVSKIQATLSSTFNKTREAFK